MFVLAAVKEQRMQMPICQLQSLHMVKGPQEGLWAEQTEGVWG